MAKEVVEVRIPAKCNELYCPVCGQEFHDPHRPEDQARCKHILFMHTDIIPEFIYVAPAYRSLVRAAEAAQDADSYVDPIQYVLDRINCDKLESVVCFAIMQRMDCLCVAFDFDPEGILTQRWEDRRAVRAAEGRGDGAVEGLD